MERLPFRLPDFCRLSWVSAVARDQWQDGLARGNAVISKLEEMTVLEGMRECSLVAVPADQFEERQQQICRRGLRLAVLDRFASNNRYTTALTRTDATNATLWCAVGRDANAQIAHDCFQAGDTDRLGRLLGYPECCVAFFRRVWNQEGNIDTTWPMAAATPADGAERIREFDIAPENNILMRWIGIRPVFHLPCSFNCSATRQVAKAIQHVARSTGCSRELEPLYRLLELPLQWTALHGIAEVTTPAFRFTTNTDATALTHTVRLRGRQKSGPRSSGLSFPFEVPRQPERRRPQANRSVAKVEIHETQSWYHEDNGFYSKHDMDLCHHPLIEAACGTEPRSILDLGCGNGALLRAIVKRTGAIPFGVDLSEDKIGHAHALLPEHLANFAVGDLFDPEYWRRFPVMDLTMLMLGRLVEVPRPRADALLAEIRRQSRQTICYAYLDWLKGQTLDSVAATFGLSLKRPIHGPNHVGLVVWNDS